MDCSVWVRDDAETSPERGFCYHPSRHSAGQPIVAGWSYQWLTQLRFAWDSWTAPLDIERVHPTDEANGIAIEQIRRLGPHLATDGPVPLFVFDADPIGQPRTGRPRRHGAKFVCADPATWPAPSDEFHTEDGRYGAVRVRAWTQLHPKQQMHAARGTRRTRPVVRGTLVLVEVSRLPRATRLPKQLWLRWAGPGAPDLDVLWRAYVHRFDIEHTLRFAKQTLLWAASRVRLPEQADRWTWLVVLAYTMLRLAKPLVADRRLPWERPRPPQRLTPYRVRRALSALLPGLGTPASPPKPCGRSPGRPKGRRSVPAACHPAPMEAA